jgi:hypothetical protein
MHFLITLLLAMSIMTVVASQVEQVCYSGFVMDKFCIDQGFMIDNGLPTLKQPEEHSIHCLVDISSCVASGYEVLVKDANAEEYERAVSLDTTGNDMVVQRAREIGSCGTCVDGYGSGQSKGFAATVVGVLDTTFTGTPPRLLVSNLLPVETSCETALLQSNSNAVAPTLMPASSSSSTVAPTLIMPASSSSSTVAPTLIMPASSSAAFEGIFVGMVTVLVTLGMMGWGRA